MYLIPDDDDEPEKEKPANDDELEQAAEDGVDTANDVFKKFLEKSEDED